MLACEPVAPRRLLGFELVAWSIRAGLRPLQAMISAPPLLFITVLGLMLFHPPDYRFPSYDRIAFVLLVFVVGLRVCVSRSRISISSQVTWPVSGLVLLSLGSILVRPYDPQTWSMFAAKWFLPFAFFLLAGYVFERPSSQRWFEIFSFAVLAYLILISIFFLFGTRQLIFPRYIVNEAYGLHIDRARGPFLQAVANGVALNLLGLVALDSYRRKRLRGLSAVLLMVALPAAILATKTRSVWLSFAASLLAVPLLNRNRRLRNSCFAVMLAGVIGMAAIAAFANGQRSLKERLAEDSQVRFRLAVFHAGSQMFLEKPLLGWGTCAMQAELSNRITEFRQEEYYFHNTYLEVVVQYGLLGLALYVWVIMDLFRIGRQQMFCAEEDGYFLDRQFRSIWPIILLVYIVNSLFVVMNYQFVNGYVFTLAGILAAQNRRHPGEAYALS